MLGVYCVTNIAQGRRHCLDALIVRLFQDILHQTEFVRQDLMTFSKHIVFMEYFITDFIEIHLLLTKPSYFELLHNSGQI